MSYHFKVEGWYNFVGRGQVRLRLNKPEFYVTRWKERGFGEVGDQPESLIVNHLKVWQSESSIYSHHCSPSPISWPHWFIPRLRNNFHPCLVLFCCKTSSMNMYPRCPHLSFAWKSSCQYHWTQSDTNRLWQCFKATSPPVNVSFRAALLPQGMKITAREWWKGWFFSTEPLVERRRST